MGIDDEPSHPSLGSGVADGVTCFIYLWGVRLFREPDAGNLPVRFDEREQETEPSQTGLRRVKRKPNPIATGRLKSLRLFSTLLAFTLRTPPRASRGELGAIALFSSVDNDAKSGFRNSHTFRHVEQ